ncbi:MAG: ABC transporter substrate-binding protein [candidate division KSB1 bacterium]|nr:ABC transporter substrate-binding protein [candidate division KSB1 bacterium]MDZ7274723.1 ABC transporter substrate-binding protein [candidate division KSB1 bacterium]MDZ7285548.1 ABC transporter substrate-binding protein [candidate division KSB1 bacterium]MDZ7298580.1 ABC transporter substrate-binding protein [candidate division KSB1 bacterium]MDZ7306759.1 ABC transporter substrate-binding protein [candidate division KSB1 bacterium]
MKSSSVLFGCAWLALGLVVTTAASQETLREKKLQFQRGVTAYNQGNYALALEQALRTVERGAQDELYTAGLYLQARCHYHLGQYSQVSEALTRLMEAHPGSRYREQAHYLLGMTAFQEGNYAEAASEFIWVLDFAETPALREAAAKHAQTLFDDYLQPNDLRRKLRRGYLGENGLALVAIALAKNEYAQGRRSEAQKIVETFLRAHPNTRFTRQLEQLKNTPQPDLTSAVRIGVIVPLSGMDAEAGQALYRGMRYALRTRGSSSGPLAQAGAGGNLPGANPAVEFVVRDSESSVVGALKAAQLLLSDPSIVALIGEYENSASSAIAALAQEKSIPILVPVSTANGIAGLGEYVFQMNADREMKGRALAEYAVRYLNCRRFATFAPQDEYGQQMTDGLSAAVDSLGGQIITQKWYYEGTEDFGKQFKGIRAAAFELSLADTLKLEQNYRSLKGVRNAALVEDVSTPVTSIHALFLPLYHEDITLIAPQRAYYNIQCLLLGGDDWQWIEPERMRELRPYIDGTVFPSDYYVDWQSERGRQFRIAYRKLTGATPERFDVLGYDAGSLLLHCVERGARKPDQIREALARIDGYPGLKGEISFKNSQRVNRRVNLLQILNAEIRRVN